MNRSQFYVTFKSASHLDNKHTVFGKVVGGHDALDRIENVPVAEKDDHRPKGDGVKILGTDVFVDPTAEADAQFEATLKAKIAARDAPKAEPVVPAKLADAPHSVGSVGKYLKRAAAPAASSDLRGTSSKKARAPAKKAYGDFSGF